MAFKGEKLNPLKGMTRIFGMNGLIELVKSIAKVVLLGAVGFWLLKDQFHAMMGLASSEVGPAIATFGNSFILAVIVMAGALVLVAIIDVPAQILQRGGRLRMSKQEIKDESKQTEGSPEMKAAVRRRQHAVLRGSARSAVTEATVILTTPTHLAVAFRYQPGVTAAPTGVPRGRGER